ncbi:hypothetical protein BA062_37735 [Prauserella flavalba]|uniref:Uncharacterized protein n=1 Tax=Prauserella flavalba TaxID=1477506 RepID=A0A318L9T1_9PSEU|nr:hypothetical protein BA062_37735 [Prauserella flavalba]
MVIMMMSMRACDAWQCSDLRKQGYTVDICSDLRFFPTLAGADIRALMSSLSLAFVHTAWGMA